MEVDIPAGMTVHAVFFKHGNAAFSATRTEFEKSMSQHTGVARES
jgi:hypothetical protein